MAIDPDQFRVLIIGGGNCGLAIATGLQKAGIKYTVFERDTEHNFFHDSKDWGTLLHWGTEYFEKLLPDDLRSRIKEARVDPNIEFPSKVPYMKADTGEILRYIDTPVITRVSRRKVRRLLTEGRSLDIRFEKKLRSVAVQDSTVTVEFEDGSKESGSMAIGCDGSHSVVRGFLVGQDAAQLDNLDYTMVNHAAKGYTASQAHSLRSYHPITQLATMHEKLPGSALLAALDIPDPNDTKDWKFQLYTSWAGPPYAKDLQDPAVRMSFIRKRMAQFCEPFRTSFLALPEDQVMPVYPTHQWAPRMKWDNHGGRVTLAGDAAHTMLPHRGQGLNNAIKDASDIVDAIRNAFDGITPLSDGISAYEAEMRVRGAKEVDLSYEQMMVMSKDDLERSPMFTMGHARNDVAK